MLCVVLCGFYVVLCVGKIVLGEGPQGGSESRKPEKL